VVVASTSGVVRCRMRKMRRSLAGLVVGRGGSAILVGSGGMGAPGSSVEGGSGASSVEGFVPDDGKLTMSVSGGGDLELRRSSLRRGCPADLEMRVRPGLETERTMASSDAHKDWVVGGNGTPWEEAIRAALLLENSSEAPNVAEPRDAQRPELVLEGGMNALRMDVVIGAGAHFEKFGWVDEVSSSEAV
jgi:hypothetical protein